MRKCVGEPSLETTIRCVKECDTKAILTIFNHYILHSTAIPRRVPITATEHHQTLQRLKELGFPALVIEHQDKVSGFGYVDRFADGQSYDPAIESHIYLCPHVLGHGLGTLLLKALVARARTVGRRTMIARIESTNFASIRVHQKCGFQIVGTLRDIGYKNNAFVSSTYMQILFEGEFNFT